MSGYPTGGSLAIRGNRRSTRTVRPASDKQRAFIERLLAEKELTGTKYDGWVPDWSKATSPLASIAIEHLMKLPRKAATQAPAPQHEAGIYQHGDVLFRVYLGQNRGAMLVKQVIVNETHTGEFKYEYLGTAARCLPREARRLSVDEVGALGKAFDHCLLCGRRLDDPESVDRGIGPVCAKRY